MRRVKILSKGGTSRGTRIFSEGGEQIHGITRIAINPIEIDNVVSASVDLALIDVEADVEASFRMEHPDSGEMKVVKRIEFADGTAVDL